MVIRGVLVWSTCSLLAIAVRGAPAPKSPSFADLLAHGALMASPSGLGGHGGDCLRVDLRNTLSTQLITSLPAGWTFVSEDSTVQDLIVVRTEAIALAPGARASVTCRAFCCESSMNGPSAGEHYRVGHQAGEKLTALATFVNGGSFPDDAVQSAVWVLSDHHDISSVTTSVSTDIQALRKEVGRLTGLPVPWYATSYSPEPGRVFSNAPAHISGQVQFDLPNNAMVSIAVQDEHHNTVKQLGQDQGFGPGHYDINVQLTVLGWASGHYDICILTDGSNVVRRIPFAL